MELRRRLGVAAMLGLLAGCAPATTWQRVELGDFRPASLAASADGVLVGGQENSAPGLVRVAGTARGAAFTLRPGEPAAQQATLISVTADADAVYAIGRMFAGAHSNPRLTIWDGTGTSGVLTSHPQEFFTFGGHDAGPLLGTMVPEGEPVILGSRTTATGAEAVLWTRSGTTWRKHTGLGAAVESDAGRVLGFTAAAQLGSRLLLAGDEVSLTGGLSQRPAVWLGSVAGSWQQVTLPLPADLSPVPGQLTHATAVACGATAESCWAAGWARGRPLAWPLNVTEGTTGAAVVLPGVPPEGSDPTALLAVVGSTPVVVTNAAAPTLQLGCADGWRALPAPPDTATAVAAGSAGLYAVTASGLWRADPPSC